MATALRTVYVELALKVTAWNKGITEAKTGVRGLAAEIDKAAVGGKLDAVAGRAQKMGLALVGAFALVEWGAAKFEQQMSKVQAVADANAEAMEALRQAALKAGRDTAYTATQAAQAEEELAKAGISVADILSGALHGALSLASAGDLDLAESATIAARAMNQFNLHGQDVDHIADLLAASANKSAADVHGLGMSLRMSGMAASAAGVTLEETIGTLSAFADRGLIASDAGTSFKQMLLQLQAPSEKAAGLMKKLGIEVYDANGSFIGTEKLAGQLTKTLGGLTQEERNSALAIIFGADAMRAANVLYAVGEQGIHDYVNAVNDQGAAARAAAVKLNNLMGDLKKLTGSFQSVSIEASHASQGPLRIFIQTIDRLVKGFGALPPVISQGALMLAGLSGASLLALSAFIKMRGSAADALIQLRAMGPAGTRAATTLERVGAHAKTAAMAFAALTIASALLKTFATELNPQLDAMAKSLGEWAQGGQLAGEAARVLGQNMQDLDVGLKFLADTDNNRRVWARRLQDQLEGIIPGLDNTSTSLAKTRERVKAIDDALAELVRGGRGDLAVSAFERLAASQAKYGVSTEELKKLFPEYVAAIQSAGGATNAIAAAHARAAVNAAILNGGLAALVREAGSLKDAFDSLHKAEIDWASAEINAEDAMDRLKQSLKENGKSLDVHTEKGRTNKKAMLDAVDVSIKAAQAKYDEEVATKGEVAALQDANDVYNAYIGRIRDTLAAQGMNKEQIKEILGLYASMPKIVTTNVKVQGATEALGFFDKLRVAIGKLPQAGQILANALSQYGASQSGFRGYRWGGITPMHAREGLLSQARVFPGTGPYYAFAEPGTGQEAFVPRNGEPHKSLGTLATAAGWYGHQLIPAGAGGTSSRQAMSMPTIVIQPTVRARDGASAVLADMVEVTVDAKLDKVATAVRGGTR